MVTDIAHLLSQTHRQDRLQYTAPQLASAQCKNNTTQKEALVNSTIPTKKKPKRQDRQSLV